MRTLFLLCGLLFLGSSAQAQCEGCHSLDSAADFCYTDSLFEGQCAQFFEGQEVFYLNHKRNKTKALPFPQEQGAMTAYLLSIADARKLKLSTADVLFVQQALQVWAVEKKKLGYAFTDSGLGIKLLKEGKGEKPVNGQRVTVHYTGYLEDGTKFDSSVDRQQPITFPLGQGRVIKGWDEGIATLPVGSKAMLRIPPALGYGSRGVGPIPANATLYFEVELLKAE